MRRFSIACITGFALAASFAVSSSKNYESKDVVGVWAVDVVQMMTDSGVAPPEGMDAAAMAAMMSITFTFREDGTITIDHNSPAGPRSEKGTWKVVGAKQDHLTIEATTEQPTGGTKETSVELAFTDRNDVTVTWKDGDRAQSMRMTRTEAKPSKAAK